MRDCLKQLLDSFIFSMRLEHRPCSFILRMSDSDTSKQPIREGRIIMSCKVPFEVATSHQPVHFQSLGNWKESGKKGRHMRKI